MTAQHDLDRELTAFLREGPTSCPTSRFDAVFDRTEQTRQRVVFGPWRLPDMNKFVTSASARLPWSSSCSSAPSFSADRTAAWTT